MSQKALVLQKKMGSFTVIDISRPSTASLAAGELLIRVQASALNPLEWKIQDFGLPVISDDQYPAVFGFDVAGDVEDVGPSETAQIAGEKKFKKGDRVFFNGAFGNVYAGYQQYTRAPADLVAKIPANLSYSQASAVPVGFLTAAVGLCAEAPIGLGLNPTLVADIKDFHGKAAIVIGGSGSVGQYAIQVLRYIGFSTIITYASTHQSTYLKSLGAKEVIDRKTVSFSDLPATVKKLTSTPIEVVYDTVSSAESQQAGYDALTNGGQMVITLSDAVKNKLDGDGKKVHGVFGSAHPESHREFGRIVFGKLPKLLEEGAIVPNRVEELLNGLEGIVDGLKRIKNNEVSGVKLVAHPQETVVFSHNEDR
ncbi:GroES-like protein [Dendrothele bispora CBS 962.96]|uniref:GroES-like protein n=1 Tax=Dendrothele bispora (strain CBS 962.96) TaxID=1314807 RepID=A0A4S8L2X0_DENBC|nr:GroES-like protein [Dendrothele bispora CBS 962.96]